MVDGLSYFPMLYFRGGRGWGEGGESDSNGGLVKFVRIFRSGESFLGQTLIKMELNEV